MDRNMLAERAMKSTLFFLFFLQVYRGPSKLKGKHGYEEIYFAPWGYYVTQPEDAKPKKGYH